MKRYDKLACGFGLALLTGLCGCNIRGRVHSTDHSDQNGNVDIHIEGKDGSDGFTLNIKGKFGKTVSQTVEAKYDAAKVETLKVTETEGSVTISPTLDTVNEVRVTAVKHVSGNESESLLKPYLKRIKPMVKFVDGVLNVYTERDEKQFGGHSGWIEYKIEVPVRIATYVQTSSGDVSIEGIQATVTAETSSGAITMEHLGGEIHAKASSGNITLKNSDIVNKLELVTTSGKIEAEQIHEQKDGSYVVLNSSSGDIVYNGMAGVLKSDTTSGNQTLTLTPATNFNGVDIRASSGDVELNLPKSLQASLALKTSSGDIELHGTDHDDADGKEIKTTLNGGNGGGPFTLESTSGDLTVNVQ